MKKTYADICIERAKRGYMTQLNSQDDVYELARRLKIACKDIRFACNLLILQGCSEESETLSKSLDELERAPEEK